MDHNDISGIIEDTNGAFTGLENLNKLWVSHVLFYLNYHFSFTFILDILTPSATKTSDIPKILLYILHWIAYYKIMPRFVLLRLNKLGRAGNLNPHLAVQIWEGKPWWQVQLNLSTGANTFLHWQIRDELLALLLWWNQRGRKMGGRQRRGFVQTHQTPRTPPFVTGAEVRKSAEAACWCTPLPKILFTLPGNMQGRIRERCAQHQSLFWCFVTARRGRQPTRDFILNLLKLVVLFDKLLVDHLCALNLHAPILCAPVHDVNRST